MNDRRLPIYFLIDASYSMAGAKMSAVNVGRQSIVNKLRTDALALEMGWISIITFGTEAQQVMKLTSLPEVQIPTIKVPRIKDANWTNLEAGLTKLMDCMDEEIVPNNIELEQKGDYKPIVILFSDGGQTWGEWHNVIERAHARFAKCQNVTAFVATGGHYRSYFNELKEIVGPTGKAIALDDFNAETFTKVINIVSQSVSRAM